MKIPMKIKQKVSEIFGAPEELTDFKGFKSLLKKDLKRLESGLAEKPEDWVLGFIALDYTYSCGTEKALVILGDRTGAWKKNMRAMLRENPKLNAFADFKIPQPGTLAVEITKGSASPSKVEKQLKKVIRGWEIVISVDDEGFDDDDELYDDDDDDLNAGPNRPVLKQIEASAIIKMLGFMDKLKGTAFRNLVLEIERYNKIKTDEQRIEALPQVHALVKSWIKGHAGESKPSSDVKKRLAALQQLEPELKKYLEQEMGSSAVQMDETAFQKTKETKARSLRDASPDVKVVELARKLQSGKGSDSDANFGAILLWLDGGIPDLENKYLYATERLFKRSSPLKTDLRKVFGSSPLRLLYLEQSLSGQLDALAELALALGLISKGWFAKENTDAAKWLTEKASATDLKRIRESSGDPATFDGALQSFFGSKDHLLKEAEAKMKINELRQTGDTEALKKASDDFLLASMESLTQQSLLGRVDPIKLMEKINLWLKDATPEEREYILNGGEGSFMAKLEASSSSLRLSGIDKSDFAYIKSRINYPPIPPKGKEAEKALNEIEAIAAKQKQMTSARKWLEKTSVNKEIQAALLSSDANPREAVVMKYGKETDIEKWRSLEKELADTDETWTRLSNKNRNEAEEKEYAALREKREQAEAAQKELEEKSMSFFDLTLQSAGLDEEQRRDIHEFIHSEGNISPAYQAIREISDSALSSKFSYTVGDDVVDLLEGIEDNKQALAAIRQDESLLWKLKSTVVGFSNRSKEQWKSIAKILGLGGSLAEPKTQKNPDTTETRSQKLLDVGNQRARILSRAERLALKEEHKEIADKPEYWAGKLWKAYKQGWTTDWNSLLRIMSQAQHKGMDGNEVLKALKNIDPAAVKAIQESKDSKAVVLQKALNDNQRPSTVELLQFSQGKLKSTTDYKQIEQAIKQASVKELLSDAFINPNSLQKENWKNMDIAEGMLKRLGAMLPIEKQTAAKTLIRERVAEAMGSEEGKKILIQANSESFTDTEIETAQQELKALSEVEQTLVSETGLQWTSMSSRALQRSAAKAKYLKEGWGRTEKLETLRQAGASKEQLEEEQALLNQRFTQVEEELQEKRQLFEERKEQLDARLQKALNIAIAAAASCIFPAVPFVSGFGSTQAVLTEFLVRSGSVVFKSALSHVSSTLLKGDRKSINFAELTESIKEKLLEDVTLDVAMDNLSKIGLEWAEDKAFLQQEVPIVGDSIALNLFELEGGPQVVLEESLLEDPLVDGVLDFIIDRDEQKEEELSERREAFSN